MKSQSSSSLLSRIGQLEELRRKTAELESLVNSERTRELADLPTRYGFDTAEDFIAAMKQAAGTSPVSSRGRSTVSGSSTVSVGGKRRKRAKVTDEMRAQVKDMVKEGKTGDEIAKTVGISSGTVANVKKALGLIKGR